MTLTFAGFSKAKIYLLVLLIYANFAGAQADKKSRKSAELPGVPPARLVSFQSGANRLNGYLFVPEGKGPFRAMVWNHGSPNHLVKHGPPSEFNTLAKVYLSDNYVLFMPDRRTPAEADRVLLEKTENPDGASSKKQKFFENQSLISDDIVAAVRWLKEQPFVDQQNIFVSGNLNGAALALLAAEKEPAIRAVVPFSPGVVLWDSRADVRNMLTDSVQNVRVPIFLIQPQNDVSLNPNHVLGRHLKKKNGLNRAKIYPPHGSTSKDAKEFAVYGWRAWGFDVLTFLDEVVAQKNVPRTN